MHRKVIIMEVKNDYAIAMTPDFEFIKIKKKGKMSEGEKIFIVEEDIINIEYDNNVIPFNKRNNNLFKKLVAVAVVMLVLISSVVYKGFNNSAYAMVSIEGNGNLEMQLDKNEKVVKATTTNSTLTEDDLDSLKHRTLEEAISMVVDDLRNDNYLLVAYFIKDNDALYERDLRTALLDDFNDIIFVKANEQDVNTCKRQKTELSDYKLKGIRSLSQIEKYLSGLEIDYDKLEKFVVEHKSTVKNADKIISQILEKKNGSTNNNIQNNNTTNTNNTVKPVYNDDDDDDDDDDDYDD